MLEVPEVNARGFEQYLSAGERVMALCRQHPIVLMKALGIWVASLVGALVLGLVVSGGGGRTGSQLGSQLGGLLVLVATLYIGWEVWSWRMSRYLISDKRALLIEGIVSRRVSTIPLSKVTETKYSRTVPGRILGYGVLLLDTPGEKPGLDTLYWLPNPDWVYRLVMSLVFSPGEVTVVKGDASARRGWSLRRSARSLAEDDTGQILPVVLDAGTEGPSE